MWLIQAVPHFVKISYDLQGPSKPTATLLNTITVIQIITICVTVLVSSHALLQTPGVLVLCTMDVTHPYTEP